MEDPLQARLKTASKSPEDVKWKEIFYDALYIGHDLYKTMVESSNRLSRAEDQIGGYLPDPNRHMKAQMSLLQKFKDKVLLSISPTASDIGLSAGGNYPMSQKSNTYFYFNKEKKVGSSVSVGYDQTQSFVCSFGVAFSPMMLLGNYGGRDMWRNVFYFDDCGTVNADRVHLHSLARQDESALSTALEKSVKIAEVMVEESSEYGSIDGLIARHGIGIVLIRGGGIAESVTRFRKSTIARVIDSRTGLTVKYSIPRIRDMTYQDPSWKV